MAELTKIIGAALFAAFAALTLKKQAPESALLVALGAGIFILSALLPLLPELREAYAALSSHIPDADAILAPAGKATGVCVLSRLSAETCRDCEQKALAAKVEFAGTVLCFLTAVPLFLRVLSGFGGLL